MTRNVTRYAALAAMLAAPALAESTRPYVVPDGYVPVWEDGRLNPLRGVGTPAGDTASNELWTDDVPRRLRDDHVLTGPQAPGQPLASIFVQVDRFATRAEASEVRELLRARGIAARNAVLRTSSNETPILVTGPFPTEAQAELSAERLRAIGYSEAFVRD